MAFCQKCGTQIADGARFCPACGAAQAGAQTGTQQNTGNAFEKMMDTPDTTSAFDQADIEQNKVMAILSYLSFLVLVPILAAPNSRFARYHANQGLVLFIVEVAYSAVELILGIVFGLIPVVGAIINGILGLVHIVFIVVSVLGIVNAANGEAKELPVIGRFRILK